MAIQTPLMEVGGTKQLAKSLRKVRDNELAAALRQANRDAAAKIVPQVQRLAPKKSGRLAKSITVKASRSSAAIKAGNNRKGATGVPYARAIHRGRYYKSGTRTKGTKYLSKAVPLAWPNLVKDYEKQLNIIALKFKQRHG